MKTFSLITTIFLFSLSATFSAIPVKDVLINKDRNKKLVVIDAGHGGHDSGALGKNSKEKNLTLEMALKLGEYLESNYPYIEVEYTRKKDEFLPLYQRINIANKKKADLFISIHCNYIGNKNTKGTETFVMGLHRANENLEVAKRENEVILLEDNYESNYEGYDPNSPVGHIILSTFQDAFLSQSLDFAARVEKNLGKRQFSTSRGVKQAGFAVLRRATMPSVLIETGFISNPEEEKKLLSEEGQHQICKSIGDGLNDYFMEFNDISIAKNIAQNKKEAEPKKDIVTEIKPEGKYRIQIAAMKTQLGDNFKNDFTGIGQLFEINENGYYKYQVGSYVSNEDAQEAKLKLINKGFKGAFVIEKN